MGLQYRYQQGEIQVNCKWFLGYSKDENKHLVIVPEEAEVVKRIYREYLDGASMLKIARGLEIDGIINGAGKAKWHTSNINSILRNEKYIGDALLQKTYTVDFLTKKRVKNNGLIPQYYVENSHEVIIPREIFMQVQEELVRRRCVHLSQNGKKRSFSSNHCFSNMVFCGECEEVFRRIHWNNRGKKSIVWRCISRLENTGLFCDARTVPESEMQEIVMRATLTSNPLSQPSNFRKTSNLLCRERKLSILLCHEPMLSNLTTQLSFYIIFDMFPWTDFFVVFSRLPKSPKISDARIPGLFRLSSALVEVQLSLLQKLAKITIMFVTKSTVYTCQRPQT